MPVGKLDILLGYAAGLRGGRRRSRRRSWRPSPSACSGWRSRAPTGRCCCSRSPTPCWAWRWGCSSRRSPAPSSRPCSSCRRSCCPSSCSAGCSAPRDGMAPVLEAISYALLPMTYAYDALDRVTRGTGDGPDRRRSCVGFTVLALVAGAATLRRRTSLMRTHHEAPPASCRRGLVRPVGAWSARQSRTIVTGCSSAGRRVGGHRGGAARCLEARGRSSCSAARPASARPPCSTGRGRARFRVLRATGVEAESDLAYATAHQLLYPLLPLLDELPEAQPSAVRVALGPRRATPRTGSWSPSASSPWSARRPASSPPLRSFVLDDVQSVGRRLAGRLCARGSRGPRTRRASCRGEQAGAARRSRGRRPARTSRGRQHSRAAIAGGGSHRSWSAICSPNAPHGNPLALVELVRLLTPDQLAGREPLPGDRSPRRTAGAPVPRPGRAALGSPLEHSCRGGRRRAGRGSRRAGRRRGGRRRERGPWRRSRPSGLARYRRAAAPPSPIRSPARPCTPTPGVRDRQEAHLRLAEALDARGSEDRAVWHRAAAALGTDDEVAAALDEVAERARVRSGYAARRRGVRTGGRPVRRRASAGCERLIAAADAAWLAGQPARARLLRRPGRAGRRPLRSRGAAAGAAGPGGVAQRRRRTRRTGCSCAGAELLARRPPRPRRWSCWRRRSRRPSYAGDLERLAEIAATWRRPRPGGRRRAGALPGGVARGERCRDARWGREDAEQPAARSSPSLSGLGDPRLTVWAGIAALQPGRRGGHAAALPAGAGTGARGGGRGEPALRPRALVDEPGASSGSFAASRAAAEEGLRLARESEQQRATGQLLAVLAFLAAHHRGREQCLRYAEEARRSPGPSGIGLTNATVSWALARLDLGAGSLRRRPSTGSRRWRPPSPATDTRSIALWSDGRPGGGRGPGPAYRRDPGGSLGTVVALARATNEAGADAMAAWCRGLLGGPDADDGPGRRRPRRFAVSGCRLAAARARLVLGELLRRDRQPRAAREHLRAALDTLPRSWVRTAWAERAAAELRASGDGGASAGGRGHRQPDRTGAPDRPLREPGRLQQGHRRPAVPQSADRGVPPLQGLPEARRHLAVPADQPVR